MDPSPESEVLHEGWMVKSPPLEAKPIPGYSLFKAKWRRRWFVLQQGKLPRQYLLNYYTDEAKKKLKGSISLDDCEQVEHGLVDKKGNYDFMFSINTRSRIYFLAVDTRKEMDTWVSMVCKACGLRDTSEDEAYDRPHLATASPTVPTASMRNLAPSAAPIYANTPVQQKPSSSSVTSPYIHISECFSGKPPPPLAPPRSMRPSESGSSRHDSASEEEQIYFYMPSSTVDRSGKSQMIMIPAEKYEKPSLMYIEIDHPKDDDVFHHTPPQLPVTGQAVPAAAAAAASSDAATASESASTIYKTVDFEMTKAFNQTRKDVEEKRFHTTELQRT